MEKVILNAEIREETGKSKVKALRKKGIIPAVVYKDGKDSINLRINRRDLFDVLHTAAGGNVLITLKISASANGISASPAFGGQGGKTDKKKKERICIIKEVQRDPVREDIIHVDLNEISLTEKIKVKVPVRLHGEAEGVVKDGGVLDHVLWELEVECLPGDIPEKIEIEIGSMKIGDTVYVKDLPASPAVKILNDPELTVLTVMPPAKEEIPGVVPAEGAEEPEVISKGKKVEEEAELEEEAKPKKEETPPAKEGKKE